MRVLIAHSRYATGSSSGENRVVEDEAALLERAGHDVISFQPTVDPNAYLTAAARAVWSRSADAAIRRSARGGRVDIFHAHNLFPSLSPAVLRTAGNVGLPTVMTLHNFRLNCLPATFLRDGAVCEDCLGSVPWRGVLHGCYRGSRAASAVLAGSLTLHRALRSFERVTLFSVVSRFVGAKLVEGGLDPSRIRVRHNFSWPMRRRDGPGSSFLVLGRLSPEKGVDTVVDAWDGNGSLMIVGDGPERCRLAASTHTGVEFRASVEPSVIPQLLADARAVLLPSRCYEGSPRVVVEALAAGVPVIASDIGGLPEHVEDGVNGLLVPVDDVDGWAMAIDRLRDDELSLKLGDGAYARWAEQFSPDVATASLEALYGEALELHGRGD